MDIPDDFFSSPGAVFFEDGCPDADSELSSVPSSFSTNETDPLAGFLDKEGDNPAVSTSSPARPEELVEVRILTTPLCLLLTLDVRSGYP